MGNLAMLALALAACGGPDLTGTYAVSHHTQNDGACTAEGPDQTDVAFFRLHEEDFFGQSFLQLDLCGDETEGSCSGAGAYLFAEEIDDGFRARYSSAGGGGGSTCFLGYGEATAVKVDDTVRIEMRAYAEDVEGLTDEQCSTNEAESRGSDMPCQSFEVLVGTLVENP